MPLLEVRVLTSSRAKVHGPAFGDDAISGGPLLGSLSGAELTLSSGADSGCTAYLFSPLPTRYPLRLLHREWNLPRVQVSASIRYLYISFTNPSSVMNLRSGCRCYTLGNGGQWSSSSPQQSYEILEILLDVYPDSSAGIRTVVAKVFGLHYYIDPNSFTACVPSHHPLAT